jgi:hypothetical protein
MLGLTRNQIINDDLGAFDDIRTRLGSRGREEVSNVFWTAFMDNSAFFTSRNTNYISGSTTNLGTDGVGLGLGSRPAADDQPGADGTKRVGMGFTRRFCWFPAGIGNNRTGSTERQPWLCVSVSSANIFANVIARWCSGA